MEMLSVGSRVVVVHAVYVPEGSRVVVVVPLGNGVMTLVVVA